MALEKETIGFYYQPPPWLLIPDYLRHILIAGITELTDGERVVLGGILVTETNINQRGAHALCDHGRPHRLCRGYYISRLFGNSRTLLKEGACLLIEGVVNWQESEVKVIANKISGLDSNLKKKEKWAFICAFPTRRKS